MDLLAIAILLLVGIWIFAAIRSAKKHRCSGCSSGCSGCTDCACRRE